MNIISQMNLFEENIFEDLGDLEILQKVISTLDDKKLIRKLYKIRGRGRNDWPCEAMWNSFIASFLFEHETINGLLRELRRNKQLRYICGFSTKRVKQKNGSIKIFTAPPASAYSKFLKNLMECQEELNEMFTNLVPFMHNNLEHFGEILMVDGKAIQSFGRKISKNKKSGCRGEHDANWSKKQYSTSGKNGESITKSTKWFGFRLHLIADATYELPVAFSVTRASNGETTETHKLLEKMEESHNEWLENCKYFLGDKGYDSTKTIDWLKNKNISPIIDIRNHWKDGEETHQYRNTQLIYNYRGNVWYVNDSGKKIELCCKGYDRSTDSLRYGFKPQKNDKRIFRISCNEDRRIFTPVARNSYKWKRIYKKRSAVERMNGRIDRDYKFERHSIRGLKKMTIFLTVTFLIYMTMAQIKVQDGKREHLCRLYA